MNIIVRPYGSKYCYCRPDTTWERENRDFYVPEGVKTLDWAPVVFVRICKAGKCIGRKFVSRYFDEVSFGALLYCLPVSDQLAFSSCADHTSILPSPRYRTEDLENGENIFEVKKEDRTIFSRGAEGLTSEIEEAICLASGLTSLRTGDYVAVELAEVSPLMSQDENCRNMSAEFCGDMLFGLKIVF